MLRQTASLLIMTSWDVLLFYPLALRPCSEIEMLGPNILSADLP